MSQGILFDQLLCTLDAIAAERPLVLLLDDLHWVDDATAAFLLHLGRELSGSRLLVLGAYRPEPVGMGRRDPATGETSRHPLASAIDELRRLNGEIVLELDRADGRAFVEAYVDMEPNQLGAGFRDALYAQTGGHALFTVELLRNLQERGELFKDEAGRWVARESLDWGSLPARIEAAIAERIERLPEQERELLSAASVQGDDFSGELVAELTGRPLREVIACLERQPGPPAPPGALRRSGARAGPCRAAGEPARLGRGRGRVQSTGSATTCFRSTSTTGSTRSNGRVGTPSWLRASSDKPAKIPRSASASPRGWPGITSRRACPCRPLARCSTRGARPFVCRPSARRSACSIVGWRCCARRTPRGRQQARSAETQSGAGRTTPADRTDGPAARPAWVGRRGTRGHPGAGG